MSKILMFPSVFLIAFFLKFLILPLTIADAIVFIGCLVLFGFLFYIENKKEKPINQEFKDEFLVMKKELNDLKSFLQTTKLISTQFGRK